MCPCPELYNVIVSPRIIEGSCFYFQPYEFSDWMSFYSVVDLTTYIYFTCFDPLVYYTFLKDFFV